MLKTIRGRRTYVIDFDPDHRPALPIIPTTKEEEPFAMAATYAIEDGHLKSKGRYHIFDVRETSDDFYYMFRFVPPGHWTEGP